MHRIFRRDSSMVHLREPSPLQLAEGYMHESQLDNDRYSVSPG